MKIHHLVLSSQSLYHSAQYVSKYPRSRPIQGHLTLMLLSEHPFIYIVKHYSTMTTCVLCTCNNWDLSNVHYLTHLPCPLGVNWTITCSLHPPHHSYKGSKSMTPVVTPLICFSNFMESCSASATLKWINNVVLISLHTEGVLIC